MMSDPADRRRFVRLGLILSVLSLIQSAWGNSRCGHDSGSAICTEVTEQQLLPLDFGGSLLGSKLDNPYLQSSWNYGCLGPIQTFGTQPACFSFAWETPLLNDEHNASVMFFPRFLQPDVMFAWRLFFW